MAEIIVVQNLGMARWLSQRIAMTHGIAANLRFPLPARFVWEVFQSQFGKLPTHSLFDRGIMHWRIFDLLPRLTEEEEFTEPAGYLQDDGDGRKRYQLAAKLSDLFDQYLVYRPDMLASWEKGEEDHWQALLWRYLCRTDDEHRGALLHKFRTLVNGNTLRRSDLPERVAFFGISSLAPFYLEVIHGISKLIDINLFCLNPCHAFWEDVASERKMAKRRAGWRRKGLLDVSDYYEVGNPLLSSLGTVGKEFNAMLEELPHRSAESYLEEQPDTLLAMLRDDILNLEDRGAAEVEKFSRTPNDHSLQFHICHSRLREVQVLHDRLLGLFEQSPELKPADILVMAPNIEEYSAAITGVFAAAPEHLRIPWSLADRHYGDEQPLVRAFLELLDLLFSRFTAPEVFAFLETPAVLEKFDLDDDSLQLLRRLVERSHIRCGLDPEHGREFGLDPSGRNTWRFGLDRLFLGYLTGLDEETFHGLTPLHEVRDSEVELLGTLGDFLDLLHGYGDAFKQPHSPGEWSELLWQLLDDFFTLPAESDEQETMSRLRRCISAFAAQCERAGFSGALPVRVVIDHLRAIVASAEESKAFLNGKVTFCNMVPMRSVPFRVIYLLGMNDFAYPRGQKAASFDLMAQKGRLGDRNRRNDDLYLFLEALISARDYFIISRVGLDQRDNSPLTPSVVVAELLDYLDQAVELPENGKKPSELLTTIHPLQPFSPRCFGPDERIAGYAARWLPVGKSENKTFLEQPLSEEREAAGPVDVAALAKFWSHPVRYFLLRRLSIDPRNHDETLEPSEPFGLDALLKYQLNEELIGRCSRGEKVELIRTRLHGTGFLPHGNFAATYFDQAVRSTDVLVEQLLPLTLEPHTPLTIELKLDSSLLRGRLNNLHATGRILARAAKFKAGDLLSLWVYHLVLNLVRPSGVEPVSVHLALDKGVRLGPVEDPASHLGELIRLYQTGRNEPLHFYPRTSWEWFLADDSKKEEAVRKAWLPINFGNVYIPGEGDDPAYPIALRGREPFDQRFIELAGTVFKPIYHYLETYNAGA